MLGGSCYPNLVCELAAQALPGSLLEMQSLRPHPDLQNPILYFYQAPREIFVNITAEETLM